jgi:4-hydroxy-3-methylbut-2-enyl diphosphate reductase
MEIIIAEKSGLCYGVQRALTIARAEKRTAKGPVSTLGDLIHNPGVIADLERRGIRSVPSPAEAEGGTIIIRSHGVSPDVYGLLARKKVRVVDATCPIVRKIQSRIEALARKGGEIVIVGDPRHPETQGLVGWSRGRGIVVATEARAKALPRRAARAVVAQSTVDAGRFARVVARLVERTGELEVINTICRSTTERLEETAGLASRVDVLFVVGGRRSSNTARLYKAARKIQPRTFWIEDAGDIEPRMVRGAGSIGLSGGASTPPGAIQQAVERIQILIEHKNPREKSVQCQM